MYGGLAILDNQTDKKTENEMDTWDYGWFSVRNKRHNPEA